MIPAARVQAAIEILDRVLRGAPTERELTAWARGSRYAGSSDRAAVRDHVFDALRRLRSSAWTGGTDPERPEAMGASRVMWGLLRGQGVDPAQFFTGAPHAPAPIDPTPTACHPMPEGIALDVPDWLRVRAGADLDASFQALRERAPVFLRANPRRASRLEVLAALRDCGIEAASDPTATHAIRLDGPARGLTNLNTFREGWFELQDAGSQALVDALPLRTGERVLDLCAGGGGKSLAMAGLGAGPIFAYDADMHRMRDIPARATRAGAAIAIVENPEALAPFDGVVADVPCSGSGAWRRAPEAKWRLTPRRLDELEAVQSSILARAAHLVRPGGWVAYMTCSILPEENAARADAAATALGLALELRCDLPCRSGGHDGFHLSVLQRVGDAV